jgi:hypothetical protein
MVNGVPYIAPLMSARALEARGESRLDKFRRIRQQIASAVVPETP